MMVDLPDDLLEAAVQGRPVQIAGRTYIPVPGTSELEGSTFPGPEAAHSATPGEFAARWNARTEEQRAAHIRWIQEDAELAQRYRRCHGLV